MNYLTPFTKRVDLESGRLHDAWQVQTRRLSDLEGLFGAPPGAAEAGGSDEGDPVVYRVYAAADTPQVEGQLLYSTTVIEPGRVGDEFYMTKGHYHAKADRAELYYCLHGRGWLLMQTPQGEVNVQEMTPGAASYVPPYWGHRSVNTGDERFAFLAVYPADAGYDYGTIVEHGFAVRVVDRGAGPETVANPAFRPAQP